MSKQLVETLIEELEALPMGGGNSEKDRLIQSFLDYLHGRLEGRA